MEDRSISSRKTGRRLKFLLVGAWRWPQYEEAFAHSLAKNGVDAKALPFSGYFAGRLGRMQQAIPIPGPATIRLNVAVIAEVKSERPDYVLFWRPTHVLPVTFRRLRAMGVKTISYNNDDPFGPRVHGNAPWHHRYLWHWYIRSLPLLDFNFLYRQINCAEAMAHGAKHAELLLPYFRPNHDRPISLTEADRERFETDLVFIGHYEPDQRVENIKALLHAGLQVKIWSGADWGRSRLGDLYDLIDPITPALGDEYTKALSGAKVCLCFLSKLNRDTYTRRCLEIPACGKVMLAERTDDLRRWFKEDEEACFFSSPEELVDKAKWLVDNPSIRERIGEAGMRRVWRDGHDVDTRVAHFLQRLAIAE